MKYDPNPAQQVGLYGTEYVETRIQTQHRRLAYMGLNMANVDPIPAQ